MRKLLIALACITTALAIAPHAAAAECLSEGSLGTPLPVPASASAGCYESGYSFESPPYSDHGSTAMTYASAYVHTPLGTIGAGAFVLEWDGEYAGPGYAGTLHIIDVQAGAYTPFTPWQNPVYLRLEQQHAEGDWGSSEHRGVAYWLPWVSPYPGQASVFGSESGCSVYAQAHGDGPSASQNVDPALCALL